MPPGGAALPGSVALLAAQFRLNPIRLSMDKANFPVAAKDMANMCGMDVGVPYRPNLPTPDGPAYQAMRHELEKSRLYRRLSIRGAKCGPISERKKAPLRVCSGVLIN